MRIGRRAGAGLAAVVLALMSAVPVAAVPGWAGPTQVIRQNYPLSPSLAIDADGALHVAYLRQSTGDGVPGIFYASNVSGVWAKQRVTTGDDFYARPSIALDGRGRAWIAFARVCFTCDPVTSSIFIASNATGRWVVTRRTSGHADLAPSLERQGGALHLAFARQEEGVYYATNEGGTWRTSLVASAVGACPLDQFPSLEVDASGDAWVAYEEPRRIRLCTGTTSGIRVATNSSGSFVSQTVSSNTEDFMPDLALDPLGRPRLVFLRSGVGTYYARKVAGTWTRELVTDGGDASLAIDSNGSAHVVFETPYVTYATNRSGSWIATPLTDYGIDFGTASGPRVELHEGTPYVVFGRSEGDGTEESLGLYEAHRL